MATWYTFICYSLHLINHTALNKLDISTAAVRNVKQQSIQIIIWCKYFDYMYLHITPQIRQTLK